MSKYYTPELEEFCVGFEYEVFCLTHWDKRKVSFSEFASDGIDLGDFSKIRVKHLDSEDIESLGFSKLNEDSEFIKNGWTHSSDAHLLHFREFDRLIQIMHIKREMLVFAGWVKSKSELKRILKQIRVL